MKTEFEATFTDVEPSVLRDTLQTVRAALAHAECLYKRYVFHPPVGVRGHVRIREEGDKKTLTYKKKIKNSDHTGNHWEEAEIQVDDIEQSISLLTNLGCKQKAYQETRREKWVLNDVEICIDTWPYLPSYLEVEGESMEAVQIVSEQLGFEWSNARFVNVTDLYMEKYGISKKQINDQTPRIVFDGPNPFK